MITKIGWKNIWRKPSRSALVVASVAIGIWVGLFFGAFQWGTTVQKVNDLVDRELGHIQIHHPKFIDEEYDYNFPIANPAAVRTVLEANKNVKTFVERAIFSAMIQTTLSQQPAVIFGVDTVQEAQLFSISSMITDGAMPKGKRAPSLLLGKSFAEKAQIELGDKISVQGGMLHGMKSFVGRVRGFYESPNKLKDQFVVYAHKGDLKNKLGDDFSHEFSVVFNDFDSLKSKQLVLQKDLPNVQVLTWGEIMPEVERGIELTDTIMFVFMMIIWTALALGIINTMLMSVLERTPELGMLMAIGMGRWKIAKMIFFETFALTAFGVPIGVFLAWLTVFIFKDSGIDLAIANEAIEGVGYSTVIYPLMKTSFYFQVIVQVILVTLVSTIFPVMRVLKMQPLDALRKS